MKRKIPVILFILFLSAYILLFPLQLRKETVFIPSWNIDIEQDPVLTGSGDEPIPFKLGDYFGYVDNRGLLAYKERTHYDAALSAEQFINYSSVQESHIIRDRKGGIIGLVDSRGYPVYKGERLYFLSADRTGISELNQEGDLLWSRTFGSIITVMESNPDTTLIGLLNGLVYLLNRKGETVYSIEPGGSRISAVYGGALSSDSGFMAVISGIDPQRLTVLERKNDSYRTIVAFNLENVFRRHLFCSFSEDDRYLFFESGGRLRYFEVKGRISGNIVHPGMLSGAVLRGKQGISAITSKNAEEVSLFMFTPSGEILLSRSIKGDFSFLGYAKELYLFGANSSLLGLVPGKM